jgi:hypothetical protein
MFRKNVSLTFQGREEFGTWFGVFLSLFYVLLVLGKGLTDSQVVWSHEIKSVST